jgi:hypothetical protein
MLSITVWAHTKDILFIQSEYFILSTKKIYIMETNNISEISNTYCYKKKNIIAITVYITLLTISMILIFLSIYLKNNHEIQIWVGSLGFILAAVSILLIFTKSKMTVLKATGSKTDTHYIYYPDNEYYNLYTVLEKKNYEQLNKFSVKSSSGLRMAALTSKDEMFAAVILEKYVPYKYESVIQPIILEKEDAFLMCEYINNKKSIDGRA